jgi:hypothetical protein
METLFSKTLGVFETILRRGGGFSDDPEFERCMIRARDARNDIAHHVLQNYDPLHATSEQRTAVLARLAQLRFVSLARGAARRPSIKVIYSCCNTKA